MAKTKKDLTPLIKQSGFDYVYDETRDLYILYKKEHLLTDKGAHLYPYGCNEVFACGTSFTDAVRHASITELRDTFQNMKPEDAEGFIANPANIDKKRQEFLDKINTGETIIRNLLEQLPMLFDYLPLTKQNKFAKNASILLYAFDIKSVYFDVYAYQEEICLRLEPVYNSIGKNSYDDDYGEFYDNVKMLCINTSCHFQRKKRPDNIVDLDGFHQAGPTRLSYLKSDDLKIGSSYIDAKGYEYLYLGGLNENVVGKQSKQDIHCYEIAFLKIRPGILKEIEKADTLQEFMQNRVNRILEKNKKDDGERDWYEGLNMTRSKKFVSHANTYFDDEHIGYDKPVLFTWWHPTSQTDIELRFRPD